MLIPCNMFCIGGSLKNYATSRDLSDRSTMPTLVSHLSELVVVRSAPRAHRILLEEANDVFCSVRILHPHRVQHILPFENV